MVERGGFEPPNPKEQIYSLPRLTTSLSPQKNGADRESRTPNLLITSQLRCQLRYVGKQNILNKMVGAIGLEPMTSCL